MAENEKIDLIISELQGMKTDIQGMKTDMQGMRSNMQGMKTDILDMKTEMQGIKTDMQDMKTEMQGIKTDMQDMKTEMQDMKSEIQDMEGGLSDVKQKVTKIELIMENEIRVNIKRVAEGHLDLSRNLHEAMRPSNEVEMLAIRVSMLESALKDLQVKVSSYEVQSHMLQ